MDLSYDNDWYRYFGDSTVYRCGKSDFSVHLPCDSKSGEKDRGEDCAESKDSGGLGSDNAGDNVE